MTDKVKACMEEIKRYKLKNPASPKCILKYKSRENTKEFKDALSEACTAEGMVARFGRFGRIVVYYTWVDYMVDFMSP